MPIAPSVQFTSDELEKDSAHSAKGHSRILVPDASGEEFDPCKDRTVATAGNGCRNKGGRRKILPDGRRLPNITRIAASWNTKLHTRDDDRLQQRCSSPNGKIRSGHKRRRDRLGPEFHGKRKTLRTGR